MNNPANMEHGAGEHPWWVEARKLKEIREKNREELRKIYNFPAERVPPPHNFIPVDSSKWSQDQVNNPADMNICLGRDAALDVYAQKCALYHASLAFRPLVGLPDPRSGEGGVMAHTRKIPGMKR
jgi:hypothetical protein